MIARIFAGAALAACAAYAAAQPPATHGQTEPVGSAATAAPDENRLAAARRFVDLALPAATLERMVAAIARGAKAEELADPATARRDRHFAERTRLTAAAVAAEAARFTREVEPEARSMLAAFYARRLGSADLRDAIAFYESPAGRRLATEAAILFDDEEYLRSSAALETSYAQAMERAAQRIAEATAHLPPLPGMTDSARGAEAAERRIEPPAPPAVAPPGGPAPDHARLAAAQRAVEAMWPEELFGRPIDFEPGLGVLLAMRVDEFGFPIPPEAGVSPDATVAEALEGFVPAFRERARIAARIFGEELTRNSRETADVYKSTAAAAYARHFTAEELDAVAGFYATPAGRRIGASSYEALEDPDFVRSTARLVVRAMTQFPGMAARVQAATAHLPPPPQARGSDRRRGRRERRD